MYGRRPEFALASLSTGLPGLLFDQEFGLLPYAPGFAVGLLALPRLFDSGRREGAVCASLLVVALLTAGAWHMWRGGFNPPARFLVPVVAPLALLLAAALRKGPWAGAVLLLGFSLFTGLAGAAEPRLVHRDRDGTAPFFRFWSGAEEWTRLLPGFVLDENAADRRSLTLVWAAALGVVAWPRGGHASRPFESARLWRGWRQPRGWPPTADIVRRRTWKRWSRRTNPSRRSLAISPRND